MLHIEIWSSNREVEVRDDQTNFSHCSALLFVLSPFGLQFVIPLFPKSPTNSFLGCFVLLDLIFIPDSSAESQLAESLF
jgi:hypothetical protein